MPKKIEDSGEANAKIDPETKLVSDCPSVFGKLFELAPENDALGSSLFSDHNPFRRKYGDDPTLANRSSGSGSPEGKMSDETPNNVETKEKNKRKKNEKGTKKNKDDVTGVATDKELDGKLKEGKKRKDNASSDVIEEKHQSVEKMGVEGNSATDVLGSDKKDKKKRKRDELEKEYEAKKYGTSASDEQLSEKVVVGKKRKNIDDPAELTISKEGYDDESKLLRTIFVGNLPLKVKKKALHKEFSQFGEVESVRIRSVPTVDGKKPKKVMVMLNMINEAADSVHAYIVFKTEQSAEASLSHNMSVFAGNHMRVDRACPPRKKLKGSDDDTALYDNKRTLFVGNLPFDVKDEELYQLFTSINQVGSSVEAVRVIRDPNTSLGKGIAYVLFKTREAANLVVRRKNLKIRERELRLAHSSSKSNTPAKRKEFPSREMNNATPGKRMAVEFKTPTSSAARNRPKMKSTPSASFEGVRATKSGTEKKKPKRHHILSARTTVNFKSQKSGGSKERSRKRPSVAARKAKANGLNKVAASGGNMSSQGGGAKKRKTGSRTPQSSFQKNKRPKKY